MYPQPKNKLLYRKQQKPDKDTDSHLLGDKSTLILHYVLCEQLSLEWISTDVWVPKSLYNTFMYLLQSKPTIRSGSTGCTLPQEGLSGEWSGTCDWVPLQTLGTAVFLPTSSSVRVAHFQRVCMHNVTSPLSMLDYPDPFFFVSSNIIIRASWPDCFT